MKPAILLMLKAPELGKVKTRLAATIGNETAVRVYCELVSKQLNELNKLSFTHQFSKQIHYAPAEGEFAMREWLGDLYEYFPQCNGNLGDRMIHASSIAAEAGHSKVLFLGGDCPYVTTKIIEEATYQLHQHDVVIGPAPDGGYYLIALSSSEVCLFEEMPWSTESLFRLTMEKATQLGLSVHLLPEQEDIDDYDSLQRALTAGVLNVEL